MVKPRNSISSCHWTFPFDYDPDKGNLYIELFSSAVEEASLSDWFETPIASATGLRGFPSGFLQGGGVTQFTFQPTLPGDFDDSESLTAADIDALSAQILVGVQDSHFDLNGDGFVTDADRLFLVSNLIGTKLGDANLDGDVLFDDFLAMSGAFGTTGGWANGDFDGNGGINFLDFLLFADAFEGDALASAVPEPGAERLLLIGFVLSSFLRTRSQARQSVTEFGNLRNR